MLYDYFIFRVFEHSIPLTTANPAQSPKCCQPGNKTAELLQSCSFSWLHKLWYSFTSVDLGQTNCETLAKVFLQLTTQMVVLIHEC